uniref:Uncharacterized protein n=1 Tax=Noccaea caerulescens TaxID=107243 RepID=A0A1J3IQC8_NOCCA
MLGTPVVILSQTLVAVKLRSRSSLHRNNSLSADRTSRVRTKPRVDAIGVKPVVTARQKPGFVSVDEIREANDALDVVFEVSRVEVYDGD